MPPPWNRLRIEHFTANGYEGAWNIGPREGSAGFDEAEVVDIVAKFGGSWLFRETEARFLEEEGGLVISLFNDIDPPERTPREYLPQHWFLRQWIED